MNNDLISRSALLENIKKSRKAHASVHSRLTVGDMEQMINGARTIDAVEVVRCKDCKYHHGTLEGFIYCMFHAMRTRIDGYCHKGKRIDAEVEG